MSNWLSGNYNLHIELFVINEGVTPVAALCPSERLLFHANMPVYPRVGLKHYLDLRVGLPLQGGVEP